MKNYTTQEFTLRPEHISLLRRAVVGWQHCETGAPEIDPKRPYGNSFVAGDVAEILGETVPRDDDDDDRRESSREPELLALHRETELALQCILADGSFEPGVFRREQYGSWRRVAP